MGRDTAAVCRHNATTDRQSQAGSLQVAAITMAHRIEHIEDFLTLVFRNPGAVGGREPHGIVQQVDQRLFDQHAVDPDQWHRIGDPDIDRQTFHYIAHAAHGTADDIMQVHPVAAQGQAAMAEAGHVEEVLYMTVQTLRLFHHGRQQIPAIFLAEGFTVFEQAGGRTDYRCERGAQIM